MRELMSSGYAMGYLGEDWRESGAEEWDQELTLTQAEADLAEFVGTRTIDGHTMRVFKLIGGYYAATNLDG